MALNVAYPKNASAKDSVSPAEWQARVDLAAAYRYVAHKEWDGGLFNHLSLRVPDEPNRFLLKPHDVLFEEVTASSLIKLDLDGAPAGFKDNINPAGFTIHSAVLNGRPDVNAVCHVHTVIGEAISAHADGLRCLAQGAMKFYNRISYHEFEGIAEHSDECARLQRDLGPKNMTLILRNHGVLTCGTSMAQSVLNLADLLGAAETQLRLEAAGAKIHEVPPEICEKTAQQFERSTQGGTSWTALLRQMDRLDPTYRN